MPWEIPNARESAPPATGGEGDMPIHLTVSAAARQRRLQRHGSVAAGTPDGWKVAPVLLHREAATATDECPPTPPQPRYALPLRALTPPQKLNQQKGGEAAPFVPVGAIRPTTMTMDRNHPEREPAEANLGLPEVGSVFAARLPLSPPASLSRAEGEVPSPPMAGQPSVARATPAEEAALPRDVPPATAPYAQLDFLPDTIEPSNDPDQSAKADSSGGALEDRCPCRRPTGGPLYASVKNRAAYKAANNGLPQPPPKAGVLSPRDYAVALGRPKQENVSVNREVADAFSRAWADDGDVVHYDGGYRLEADAPPAKDSRAASGWLPVPGDVRESNGGAAGDRPEPEEDNQLFEAYGASYAEAYAVALAMAFSEEKPVPDNTVGDVAGPVSSILHMPSGEPFLLGTVAPQMDPDEEGWVAGAAESLQEVAEPPLSRGRLFVRYALLGVAAVTVGAAGLYFFGLIP